MSQVTASSTWVCAYRQAAWSFFDISMAPLLFSVCISSHSKASSTRRQPRGFQGHRSPVLVSPGQFLHSFYPLDSILCRHSLSLLASWLGLDLPAGGVPSSPASYCPSAAFRVLCFRFLYSGLLLVFQVAGSHFLGESAPFHTGPLYLNRVSFSLWGTYHKPSCLTSHSPFRASRTWHSPKGAKTALSQWHHMVPGTLGHQVRLAG